MGEIREADWTNLLGSWPWVTLLGLEEDERRNSDTLGKRVKKPLPPHLPSEA
jgi:hypothetical protein